MTRQCKTNFSHAVKKSQLTASELAKIAGITPQAISKLRKNGIKSINTAKKMGEILNVPPLSLLDI